MDDSRDPFYGIAPGHGPLWVTLGSTHMVKLDSLPRPQHDAILGMVERLRELFTADPAAFDAAVGWVARQMDEDGPGGLDDEDMFERGDGLMSAPIVVHRSEDMT